ncbi:MAG: hypothetical protein QOF62_620 [Pyrinomonadaceae bacterium]|jgi:hypothetical protein|nr:hypothetical protein [Pyrinomonadaceae bacterium]
MKPLASIFWFILICALGMMWAHAQAAPKSPKPKSDFSGTWLLDTAKSNVGSSATPDQPLKITHRDPEFRITRMVASNGQLTGRDFVYFTDGRGETNPTIVFLSTSTDVHAQGHDKDVTKSRTTWSGNKLVTRSTVRGPVSGRSLEFEIIDEWKLSSDGKTLTQTSRTVFRQDMSGVIFVPANRPDIKRVYNRIPD